MSEILEKANDYVKWLQDNPGENIEVTFKFDREAIEKMDPDKLDDIINDDVKAILGAIVLKGLKKYLREKK